MNKLSDKKPPETGPTRPDTDGVRRDFLRGVGLLGGAVSLAPVTAALAAQDGGSGTESLAALRALQNTLADISTRYFVPARGITDPADIVEGQRFIMHLLSAAIDFYLEGDPARPWFANMVSPTRKYLGDNPDARYFFAPIYGDRYYRIRGRRLAREYIAFTVHTGGHGGNWNGPGITHINHRNIAFRSDGQYELILGPEQRGKNWLKTTSEAVYVINRNYYENQHNAAADPSIQPDISIEPLDPIPPPPQRLSDAETARRLRAVANFIRVSTVDMPLQTPKTVPDWFSLVPNTIGKPFRFGDNQRDVGLGALDNTYAAGNYVLEPGQALTIEGRLPRCYFANVVLWNRFMQCGDYRYRQVSLNRTQMQQQPRGNYRIVVAAENPGVPNWLDTGGRLSGTVFWRFLLAEEETQTPQCRVVELAELAAGN